MKIEVVGSGSILHGIDGSKVLEIRPGIYDTDAPDSVLTRELAEHLIKTSNGHAREYKPLKGSVENVVHDAPQTAPAAKPFKRILAKAGKGAAEAFKNILVGVISEAAKKLIWPG